MIFLNSFFALIFFIFLFAIFYFLIQRFKALPIIINLRIFPVFIDIIEGFVFGLLFYFFNIPGIGNYSSFIPYFLIGYITLTLYRNATVGAFSLVLPLITFLLVGKYALDIYVYIAITFIYTCSFQISSYFSNNLRSRVISYSILFVLCLSGILIILFLINQKLEYFLTNNIILFIGIIALDLLFFWGIKISISANLLHESVNFDFSNFYRSSIKNRIISENITNDKLKQGVFGVFKIDFPNQNNIQRNREILETILTKIEKYFPEKIILFKRDNASYGFFMPFIKKIDIKNSIEGNYLKQRLLQDSLYNLENKLKKISGKYETSFTKNINVSLSAGVSIYGIQSYSLKELEQFAIFALRNINEKFTNRIFLFDPEAYIENIKQKKQVDNLEKIIPLDDFSIEFVPIYNTLNKKTILNYSRIVLESHTGIEYSVKEYLQSLYSSDIFYRYFSSEVLKIFQKNAKNSFFKITIPYPLATLNKKMDVDNFIKKIQLLDINLGKIIIEVIYYKGDKINNYFLENAKLLKNQGIKFLFAFENSEKNENLLKDFQFDYFLYNQKNAPLKKITNETILLFDEEPFIYKKKYKNIGGKLFFVDNNPTILNKKSKINLNTL